MRQSKIIEKSFFLDNLFVLAIIYMTTALPFTIYLLSNFFQSLPSTFEEAAAIDGADHFTTMVKVMAPMARPSITTMLMMMVVGVFGMSLSFNICVRHSARNSSLS